MVEDEEFGWRTVQAAKKKLKIESNREGGSFGKWIWRLPEKKEETEETEEEMEKEQPKAETPEEEKKKPENGDGKGLAELYRNVREEMS